MSGLITFEKYYDVFRDISRIVHASVDVDEVLELVAWKSAEMFGAEGAFLRIVNLKTQALENYASYGLDDDHLALQTEKLSALGRMAAGIAHEINNPLAGILLFATNMLKKCPDDGPFRDGLDVIINETQRCKTIIQDLLESSRDKDPRKAPAGLVRIFQGFECWFRSSTNAEPARELSLFFQYWKGSG